MLAPQNSQNSESSSTSFLHFRQRTSICGTVTLASRGDIVCCGAAAAALPTPELLGVGVDSDDVGGGTGLLVEGARLADSVEFNGDRHFTQNFHPGWAAAPQAGHFGEGTSLSAPPHASQNLRLSGKLRLHRLQLFIIVHPG